MGYLLFLWFIKKCIFLNMQYENYLRFYFFSKTRLCFQKGTSGKRGVILYSGQYGSICAIKLTISLEIKCPQLSKPEAKEARKHNSIGYRMEKKLWEKPGSVGGRGGQFSSGQMNQQFVPCCSKFRLCRGLIWFPWYYPVVRLGDEFFTGDLSLGLI